MRRGFVYSDGGRKAAGYRGKAGDCVTRAIAIATQQPYAVVYAALSHGCRTQRRGRNKKAHKGTAAHGVVVQRKWFKQYMANLGWVWVPTMHIGNGCTVHLRADELPAGRLVVNLSRHMSAVVDGVVHDTYDPRRRGTRCVYGYWHKAVAQ